MAAVMNAPLYTIEILRLAGSLPDPVHLERVDGMAQLRSPTCGSTVRTEVQLEDGSGHGHFPAGPRLRLWPGFGGAGREARAGPDQGRNRRGAGRPVGLARREPRGSGRLGARSARPGAVADLASWRDPAAAQGIACGDRGRGSVNHAQTAVAGATLLSIAFMLGAALIFVTLFRKLGLGATLGYIVGGAVIGPYALGLIADPDAVMRVSEIGIAFLLFLVGLELNPSRLWRLRKDIFGLGLIQVVLCGLALSALIYLAIGFSMQASLALGLPLALSSTAQVLPMLRSSGQLNTPRGERAFSVLLFQDLSIVPMITIIAALSRSPLDPQAPPGWLLALYTSARSSAWCWPGDTSSTPCSGWSAGLASASCSSSPACSRSSPARR